MSPAAASPPAGSSPAPACHHEEGCITCGDVAVALEVVEVDRADELAVCAAADGRRETVDLGLLPDVTAGERLLVHAGTALTRLDQQGAG